jgi:signal transduction histidine kinase
VLQLSEGIDLDGAFGYAGNRNETLEKKVEQIQGLAQIGISVEILNHELETLDRRLNAGLLALPANVRATREYQSVDSARRELVERLRFLSQMQISSGDIKQEISGQDVGNYLHSFFDTILENREVTLVVEKDFANAKFHEFPSRIYPVFINLVNNSIYWLSKSTIKEIRLSAKSGTVIVSDTGPGIDEDDVGSLFELFFTRRVRGRGVGLYLCKQTLASGGHEIYYATDPKEKVLSGANFIIKLRDGFHV